MGESRFRGRRCQARVFLRRGHHAFALAEERSAVVLRQTFRANDAREQSAIREILFDGAERILAGEKSRPHPAGAVVAPDQRRFLNVDFENDVALVKFWSAGEIADREKKARKKAEHEDPKFLEDRVPKVAEVDAFS